MNRSYKLFLTILFLLVMYSVKVDLSTPPLNHSTNDIENNQKVSQNSNFTVVSYKMKHTDTFISVVDQLNPNLQKYDLNKIRNDFEKLNPKINISQLQSDVYYLFPVYNK